MSLEAIIQENTNAIRELIAAIQAGVPTTAAAQVAAVVTEAKAEKAPAKKETAKAEEKKPDAGAAQTAETQPSATTEGAESSTAEQKPEALTQMTAAEAEKALHGHANNPADAPTYQATADAVTKLARTKGRDTAIAVLAKFGAGKLPDVKPEQFAAVITACEEAGA